MLSIKPKADYCQDKYITGIIRKDIPIRLMIEIWLGVVEAVINPSKLTELGLTPKDGFSAVISVMLEGLLTAEGRSKP